MKNRLLKVAKYLGSQGLYEEAAQIKKIAVEDEPEWGRGPENQRIRQATLGSLVVGGSLRRIASPDSGMVDLPITRSVEQILNNLGKELMWARKAQQKTRPDAYGSRPHPDLEFAEMIHKAFQEITDRRGDWRSIDDGERGPESKVSRWGFQLVQAVTQLVDAEE